jgi:hypothetical protein
MVAVRLLRRIAIVAVSLSLALWIVPKVLTELGVLGPTPQEYVESADRAIAVARTYGAAPLPAFKSAEQERDRARALAGAGKRRETREAAEHAMAMAAEAQKQALVRKAAAQQQAEVVYNDLDRQVNDLEKLYDATTPGLEKEQVGELLSMMKLTRQSAGTVFLAYENKDWETVLKGEPHARDVIASTRKALQAARK